MLYIRAPAGSRRRRARALGTRADAARRRGDDSGARGLLPVCDAEQRRLLAFASERKRCPAEFRDLPGRRCARGRARAGRGHGRDLRRRATRPILYVIHEQGAVLGAMALVIAKPRPVTVKAVDNVETLFVPRTAFMKLANQASGSRGGAPPTASAAS